MGADPISQPLGPSGLGVGIVGGTEHRDEDLRFADFAGVSIDHRDRLAGLVYEQLLTGPVILAHDPIELALPAPIRLTEPAGLQTLRVNSLVLLPQQGQRHALALEFPVDLSPVREQTPATLGLRGPERGAVAGPYRPTPRAGASSLTQPSWRGAPSRRWWPVRR